MLDRYRDCDSEWELLSENGFVDIFLLVLSYAFTQKMVGIGINEILKGSFIKQAKFCVNLAFLSAIYGYTAIIFVAILSSFVYIFGKMVRNRLVLMLVLANALIMIFSYPDIVSIVVEHGKHFQSAFESSIESQNKFPNSQTRTVLHRNHSNRNYLVFISIGEL